MEKKLDNAKRLYAIQDIKAEIVETPIMFATHAEAIRQFGDIIKDERFKYHKHPSDYRLLCVSNDYNTSTGCIQSMIPTIVIEGINLQEPKGE